MPKEIEKIIKEGIQEPLKALDEALNNQASNLLEAVVDVLKQETLDEEENITHTKIKDED